MEEQTTETELGTMTAAAIPEIQWGADAPRGGKAVLNRILKEKATVPLFFAQTLLTKALFVQPFVPRWFLA